jgi:chromosome segregation ATPase
LVAALVLLTGSAFSEASANDDDRGGVDGARALVKQLEAQVESQRAALKVTEASLAKARSLLYSLEPKGPIASKAAELRSRECKLEKQLQNLRRRLRAPERDPALVSVTRKLAEVRGEIEALDGK